MQSLRPRTDVRHRCHPEEGRRRSEGPYGAVHHLFSRKDHARCMQRNAVAATRNWPLFFCYLRALYPTRRGHSTLNDLEAH